MSTKNLLFSIEGKVTGLLPLLREALLQVGGTEAVHGEANVAPLLQVVLRDVGDVLVVTLANKGARPLLFDPIDLILCDPVRDADVIADALLAYLDSGVAPGTIALDSTFVAGEE